MMKLLFVKMLGALKVWTRNQKCWAKKIKAFLLYKTFVTSCIVTISSFVYNYSLSPYIPWLILWELQFANCQLLLTNNMRFDRIMAAPIYLTDPNAILDCPLWVWAALNISDERALEQNSENRIKICQICFNDQCWKSPLVILHYWLIWSNHGDRFPWPDLFCFSLSFWSPQLQS